MKIKKILFAKVLDVLYVTMLIQLVIAQPVYAYIDPGTGSMIIQILLASIATAGVTLRIFWGRIQVFFSGLKKNDNSKNADITDENK